MDMVDVAFSLRGGTIPADHGWHLFRLLAERLELLPNLRVRYPGLRSHPQHAIAARQMQRGFGRRLPA